MPNCQAPSLIIDGCQEASKEILENQGSEQTRRDNEGEDAQLEHGLGRRSRVSNEGRSTNKSIWQHKGIRESLGSCKLSLVEKSHLRDVRDLIHARVPPYPEAVERASGNQRLDKVGSGIEMGDRGTHISGPHTSGVLGPWLESRVHQDQLMLSPLKSSLIHILWLDQDAG